MQNLIRDTVLNISESKVYNISNETTSQFKAKVFPKIRIADIFDIPRNTPPHLYSYALKAHFDFTITDENYRPLFAIEYDGPTHTSNTATIANDKKKNDLCTMHAFPLLRINKNYIDIKFRKFTILQWLIELYFLGEGFYEQQSKGLISEDEFFDYAWIIANSLDEAATRITFPYRLCYPNFSHIKKMIAQNDLASVSFISYSKNRRRHGICCAFFPDRSSYIYQTSVQSFNFHYISDSDLVEELTLYNIGERLKNNKYRTMDSNKAECMLKTIQNNYSMSRAFSFGRELPSDIKL